MRLLKGGRESTAEKHLQIIIIRLSVCVSADEAGGGRGRWGGSDTMFL